MANIASYSIDWELNHKILYVTKGIEIICVLFVGENWSPRFLIENFDDEKSYA